MSMEMRKQNKYGVSLIVLVITIIIMIILAGAVVLTLSNSGIISKANVATAATDLAQVQDLASMLWADAYLDKTTSQEDLEEAVIKGLNDAKVVTKKYAIDVTKSGVTVTKAGPWKLEKTVTDGKVTAVTVTNGTLTLDVGTQINYMPSGVGPTGRQYTGGWKILGVDDSGRLLIMSNESITGSTVTLGGSNLSEATKSYLNALTILQNAVKGYKDGKIGVKVRSVKAEDVNALTSFDKTTYKAVEMRAYENEVTYTWKEVAEGEDADYRPVYSYVYNGETKSGQLSTNHSNGFTYYDKETGKIITVPYSNGGAITMLKSDFYSYGGANYLADTTPAYKMIFRKVDDSDYVTYWLANSCVATLDSSAATGMRVVNNGGVSMATLFSAQESLNYKSFEVRAVVTLASDIQLKPGTNATWEIAN